MSNKMGEQQRYFLQYCKKVMRILETINRSGQEDKKQFITANAGLLRTIGESFLDIVKAFGDMDGYDLMQQMNHDSLGASWTDSVGFEDAYDYVENLTKVARNVIEIGEHTNQQKCLCCQDRVYFIPSSPRFLEICGIQNTMSGFCDFNESICPSCMSNDRDRALVCFLRQVGLNRGNMPVQALSLTHSRVVEHWIYAECPAVIYQLADSGLDKKTFSASVQIAEMPNESCDYIFCSDMMFCEKTQDFLPDELMRVIKEDGLCLFSVPIFPASEQKRQEQELLNTELIKKFIDSGFKLYKWMQDAHNDDDFEDFAAVYLLTKIEKDVDDIIVQKAASRFDRSAQQPLVSVLMSVYNHEKYVSKAIESVLSQGYEEIEFLVADDCSMDGSADEILKYKDQIDRLYLFEENGFGRIPFLLSEAKGKYVAVLDSDDYWEPDKIEKQVIYMETHPACGACFTGVRCVDQNGEELNIRLFAVENKSSAGWINFFYRYGNCLAYSSVLIRKEIHIGVMNRASNFSIVPDYIMWLHVALDHGIHLIEQELINYRWHDSNDSKESDRRMRSQYFEENYCWLEVMKMMDAALFLKIFRDELADPDVREPREILCEKALILLNSQDAKYRLAGLFFVYEILSDQENKKVMQEKYHLGRQGIYEMLNSI